MYKVCCYWSRQRLYPAAFVVLVGLEVDFFFWIIYYSEKNELRIPGLLNSINVFLIWGETGQGGYPAS